MFAGTTYGLAEGSDRHLLLEELCSVSSAVLRFADDTRHADMEIWETVEEAQLSRPDIPVDVAKIRPVLE